jgi:hypothetical protein
MTRLELQAQIRALREELENRYKTGTVKLAAADGTPIPTKDVQNQLFSLIYRLSKIE